MANYFFFHDLDTCIGCQACQVACKDLHDPPCWPACPKGP